MQIGEMDCGAACLTMVGKYYGRDYRLQTIREMAEIGREGASLRGLAEAAEKLGFRARPRLSLGLEGGVVGNQEYDAGRGGGFLRVTFRDFETTLSGGFTGNYLEDDPSFYLALGLYRPF